MKRVVVSAMACALAASALVAVSPGPAVAFTPTVKPQERTIAAGQDHTLVIGGDGRVYGAGHNNHGQLTGSGDRTVLTALSGLPVGVRAVSVAAGAVHSLVLGSDGRVYGAGFNNLGIITGVGDRNTLTPLTGLPAGVRATAITAGLFASFVVASDGKAYSTGQNDFGNLTGLDNRSTLTPMTGLPAGVAARAIAAGQDHTVVLGSNGRAYGTGRDVHGALSGLGDRSTLTELRGMPVGITFTAVAAGRDNTVLLGSNRRAYVLGSNGDGQLGTGVLDVDSHPTMTSLPGLDNIVAVASGEATVVAVDAFGTAWATGSNSSFRLGTDGSQAVSPTPMRLATGQPTNGRVVEVSAGDRGTVVRDSSGVVLGVGENFWAQLTGVPGAFIKALTALSGQRVAPYVRPSVTGTSQVGFTLRARPGAWSVVPTRFAFRWLRDGRPIPFATSSSYRLNRFDKGHRISVRVSASRGGGFLPGTLPSLPTRPVR